MDAHLFCVTVAPGQPRPSPKKAYFLITAPPVHHHQGPETFTNIRGPNYDFPKLTWYFYLNLHLWNSCENMPLLEWICLSSWLPGLGASPQRSCEICSFVWHGACWAMLVYNSRVLLHGLTPSWEGELALLRGQSLFSLAPAPPCPSTVCHELTDTPQGPYQKMSRKPMAPPASNKPLFIIIYLLSGMQPKMG